VYPPQHAWGAFPGGAPPGPSATAARIDVGADMPMVGLVKMWPLIVLAGFGALCTAGVAASFGMTAAITESSRAQSVPGTIVSGLIAAAMIGLTVWMVRKQVRNRKQFTGSRHGLLIDGFGIWWREENRCFPIAWSELAEVTVGSKRMWSGNTAMDMYIVLTPARPEEFWPRHPELHALHDDGACWIHAPASGLSHGTLRHAVVGFAPHLRRVGAHRNPLAQAKAEAADRIVYGSVPPLGSRPPHHGGPPA
jgi:hypothetical protein